MGGASSQVQSNQEDSTTPTTLAGQLYKLIVNGKNQEAQNFIKTHHINVNKPEPKYQVSALGGAIFCQNVEGMGILVRAGAEPNERTLMMAYKNGLLSTLLQFLEEREREREPPVDQ